MIDLAVDALAVHRITRLVTRDTITRPVRVRIIRWAYEDGGRDPDWSDAAWDAFPHGDDNAPKVAALVTCPWCVSIYAASAVVAARLFAPGLWRPVARLLALSSIAFLISNREEPSA